MKTGKPIAILATATVAGLGLTALATPASAEGITVTVSGEWKLEGDVYVSNGDAGTPGTVDPADFPGTTFSGTEITLTFTDTFKPAETSFFVVSLGLTTEGGDDCSGEPNPCSITADDSLKLLIKENAINAKVALQTSLLDSLYDLANGFFKVSYSTTPDPTPDSAPAPAPAPTTVDVTLDQITSEVLRTWASTATLGSWKQLPESTEITGVDENAGKTFLGAATTPDFPVDIAQRQVDNGWGAYETFNEDGDLTSVFIPAGGWMAITNSTRLYAVWSN